MQSARVHARRRLAGTLVLLVAGVAVFPVLFETQPRPMAVDTPIVMPAREPAPAVRSPSPSPSAPLPVGALPADAGVESTTTAVAQASAEAPASSVAPAASASRSDDGARAQALLDARSAAASEPQAGTLRFVVQAGAYSEAGALREARQKVEKMGLKTYTQVIESDSGKRTRVRIGPFTTRQEAQAVADKVKAAGLQVSILAL